MEKVKVRCLCGWWLMSIRGISHGYIEDKCPKCKMVVEIEVREGRAQVRYSKQSA